MQQLTHTLDVGICTGRVTGLPADLDGLHAAQLQTSQALATSRVLPHRTLRSQGAATAQTTPLPDDEAIPRSPESPSRSSSLNDHAQWDRRAEKRRGSPTSGSPDGCEPKGEQRSRDTRRGGRLNGLGVPFKSRGRTQEPIVALALRPGSRTGERRPRPEPGSCAQVALPAFGA